MKKRTSRFVVAALVACAVGTGAIAYLYSASTPSYEKILRLNDELKQARQLGLSTQDKCTARLGEAIQKTKDETVLAKLLSTENLEDRFTVEMLGRIHDPVAFESIALNYNPDLLVVLDPQRGGASSNKSALSTFGNILARLQDDDAVERVVNQRLSTWMENQKAHNENSVQKRFGNRLLMQILFSRVTAMDNKDRAIALLIQWTRPDVLSEDEFSDLSWQLISSLRKQGLSEKFLLAFHDPFQFSRIEDKEICEIALHHREEKIRIKAAVEASRDVRLEIALRSREPRVREKTGIREEIYELGDLVAKWDTEAMSGSIREILDRGKDIKQNLKYIDIVKQFNSDFKGNSFDEWVSYGREIENAQEYIAVIQRFDPVFKRENVGEWVAYGKEVKPVLEKYEALLQQSPSSVPDPSRRKILIEKRNEARAASKQWRDLIAEIKAKDGLEYAAAITAACRQFGIYMDPDDPEGTGWRLGTKMKEMYQQADQEANEAERELATLDAKIKAHETIKPELDRLKEELVEIQRRFETPETRKAHEEKAEAERVANEKNEAVRKAREEAERVARARGPIPWLLASMVPIPGKNYSMGKYEVTQSLWEAVMGDNPSRFKGADNPVEEVSWNDCQEFLRKLNERSDVKATGLVFRLPTEEEWEYACRAGATGDYCKLAGGTEISEDTLGQVAWYWDNSNETTHPVGQKEANAFGLYDMHGNVWEWTQTADGEYRVNRGGSWHDPDRWCDSSHRLRRSPGGRDDGLGFRLCAEKRQE